MQEEIVSSKTALDGSKYAEGEYEPFVRAILPSSGKILYWSTETKRGTAYDFTKHNYGP